MSQGVKQLVKELLYTLQELTLGHLVIANTKRTESDYTPILNLTMYIFIKVFCHRIIFLHTRTSELQSGSELILLLRKDVD